MNYKLIAAVAFALVVGLLAWSSFRPSEAQGQAGQERLAWEYKVVAFVVDDPSHRNVDGHTKQVNSLAAEGWEYVGLLCAGPTPHHTGIQGWVGSGGNVLFRRAKK